ncbi:MAG: hypothetical protein K9I68_11275 [Bacteroidales bacterium]|nr:hypothetical protein [Bacteroidales bacterium]MCF8338408.1 hypothetical protein [Bacteroidales bacterium]
MNTTLKKLLIQYLKNILLLTGIIALLAWGLYSFLPSIFSPLLFWFIPYFLIISLAFHYYLLKASAKDTKKFIPHFMGSTGIKLMIYLGTLTLTALMIENDPAPFIVGFFVLYLFYTIFEIKVFLQQSRQMQN